MQVTERRPAGRFARAAQSATTFCNEHSLLVIAALTAWYVVLVWNLARRPLWYDELFTFYIAQQPTVARMLVAIHTIDLNPPLNYFLTRWSIGLFGASPWATRLPALLTFWCGSVAIFLLLRRRASALIAALGVLLFWSSPFFPYAAEARPYGLLLGFTAILLAAWDSAASGRRVLGLGAVLVSGSLLLLSHLFGALSLGAVWSAEAVRSGRRRKIDEPMLIVLLLPLVATLTYAPMFHAFSHSVFPPEAQASLGKLYFLYFAVFRWMWRPLLAIVLAGIFWGSRRKLFGENAAGLGAGLALLFLVPVAVTILFMRSHGAFYDRYAMAAVLPIVLVAPLWLWRWTNANASAALAALCAVAALLLLSTALRAPLVHAAALVLPEKAAAKTAGLLMTSGHGPFRPWWKKLPVPEELLEERAQAPVLSSLDSFHRELPLVAESELTFFEMDQRASERLAHRLFFVYDRTAELEIAHRSVADGVLAAQNFFPLRGKITPYEAFVDQHRQFLVIGMYEHPGDWLLRKVQQDGASLQVVARDNDYEDSEIYLVTLPTQTKSEAEAPPSAQP